VESAAIIDRCASKMNTMMSDLIGYTAASCTTISFLPQVIKALRDRDTQSLSLGMYFIFTVGACLWCVYGYVRHELVIVIANSITASFCLLILIVKMRNDVFGRQEK
jgi:MtN3 and saliva related transmembrane protein